jgi:hypothetical protein
LLGDLNSGGIYIQDKKGTYKKPREAVPIFTLILTSLVSLKKRPLSASGGHPSILEKKDLLIPNSNKNEKEESRIILTTMKVILGKKNSNQ